jgi:subtilisin family serine protease
VRPKPDIAAADGVQTATPGFNPFYGTSASGTHAAAIAALLVSAEPSLSPEVVRDVLTTTALDIEAPGWDRDSGSGIVMADLAMSYVGLFVRPLDPFRSYGREDGPFNPSSKAYTLTNIGDSAIDWEANHGQGWVTLSASSGTLLAGESTIVTVSIDNEAETLGVGSHRDTIYFNNSTSGNEIATRVVNLLVRGICPGVYLLLL